MEMEKEAVQLGNVRAEIAETVAIGVSVVAASDVWPS